MRTSAKPRRSTRRSRSTRAVKRLVGANERLRAEREVLRALCQNAVRSDVLDKSIALFAHYHFLEPAHQVLFEALRDLGGTGTRQIRELLPVRVNNRGFPDMDLEPLFASSSLTTKQLFALLRALRDRR